jgi:predicted O-methyltransferase YrrM
MNSLSRARTEAHDLLAVARESINFPKDRYLERRRLRTESQRFTEAWAKASFIGGWLGRPGAELLFELAGAVSCGQDIVELGSYLGRSTAFLAMGADSGITVHAVDPHDQELTRATTGASLTNTGSLFRIHMEEVGVADHVEAHEEVSLEASQSYKGKPLGLLFVDATHTEEAVIEDGRAWSAHAAPGCLVSFDDINTPAVRKGVTRLVDDGVIPRIAGRVGKIGICGPPDNWPERVRSIAIRV